MPPRLTPAQEAECGYLEVQIITQKTYTSPTLYGTGCLTLGDINPLDLNQTYWSLHLHLQERQNSSSTPSPYLPFQSNATPSKHDIQRRIEATEAILSHPVVSKTCKTINAYFEQREARKKYGVLVEPYHEWCMRGILDEFEVVRVVEGRVREGLEGDREAFRVVDEREREVRRMIYLGCSVGASSYGGVKIYR